MNTATTETQATQVDVPALRSELEVAGVATSNTTLLLCATATLQASYRKHVSAYTHAWFMGEHFNRLDASERRHENWRYQEAKANSEAAYQRCEAQYEMLMMMLLVCTDTQKESILRILHVTPPNSCPALAL